MTTDTWTSGKILPTPENDRQIANYFLAVCAPCSSKRVAMLGEYVTIEWFWFDANEWRDENDSPIQVSAWRRIPMDGIDEAVRQGEQP